MTRTDHILVIDDDAEIRSLLEAYLTRQGYRVTTAADARTMRTALERVAPDLMENSGLSPIAYYSPL